MVGEFFVDNIEVKICKPWQIHHWLQICPKILGFLCFITEKDEVENLGGLQTAGSCEAASCCYNIQHSFTFDSL